MKKLNIICPEAIRDQEQMEIIRLSLNDLGHRLSVLFDPYDIFKMKREDMDLIIIEPSMHSWKWLDILIKGRHEFPEIPVILCSLDISAENGFKRLQENDLVYLTDDIKKFTDQLEDIIKLKEDMKKRILFVDDDKFILKSYMRMLHNAPWKIFTAESGDEALKIIDKEKMNMVFTDIKMPNMHGIELITKIRAISEDIPIVACSAFPRMKDDENLQYYKITTFLEKPMDSKTLKDTIRNALA